MIAAIHKALCAHWPNIGVLVNGAVAQAESGQTSRAMSMLDALDPALVERYPAYWVARARVHALAGDAARAKLARTRAAGLTHAPAVRAYLLGDCVL